MEEDYTTVFLSVNKRWDFYKKRANGNMKRNESGLVGTMCTTRHKNKKGEMGA